MKYADGTNLLVPETSKCTLSEEFEHIKDWAITNKIKSNQIKSNLFAINKVHNKRL